MGTQPLYYTSSKLGVGTILFTANLLDQQGVAPFSAD